MDVSFTSPELFPFTLGLFVVIFIFALELVGILIGYSSMVDADVDVDMDVPDLGPDLNLDADLDAAFGDAEFEIDLDPSGWPGVWAFLEFGRVPLLVWILSYAGGFAMSGYFIQLITNAIAGFMWFPIIAVAMAFLPTLFIGKFIAVLFTLLVPKVSTQAVSANSLAGRHAVITVGTATETSPAVARVLDQNGNSHQIRVEPYPGEGELPSGTDIVILRGLDGDLVWRGMRLDIAKQRHSKS